MKSARVAMEIVSISEEHLEMSICSLHEITVNKSQFNKISLPARQKLLEAHMNMLTALEKIRSIQY